ncbi:MFS transporter [Kerstersia sp.]|uniref:MFS transporter n=1 Tax=Kerstersia sp. TaxID=1930783 RepID=UPI003F910C40
MNTARRRAALAAAYLGTFLATLDISIVNVALPTMQTALDTDIAGLQWVVNAYAICLSAFMLSAGPASDRHGHKRAWLAGVVLFTAGSALCGLAPTLGILLAGRAVQGLSAALLIAGALPILTHIFPEPKARASAIGGWSAFSALALILGPLLGGLLLDSFGWQSIFLINLPLGLLAIALGAWGIPERRFPDHAARDPWGQALSILALGALAYGLIQAGETGFATPLTLLTLGLALVCLLLFAMVERRVERPLLPLALFRQPAFVLANNASFMLGFAYYSSLFFFSIYLQQIHGWSPVETGWRMMPQFFVTGCLSMLFGRLGMWLPVRTLMISGYALIAIAMFAMMLCDAQTDYVFIGINLAVLGAGAGLAVPATSLVIMGMAPPEQAGSVSATMNALRQAGMTLGIALLGALMSSRAIHQLTASAADAGLPDAPALAYQAITQHQFPADLAAQLMERYIAAMTGGFHLAMLGAGVSALLAIGGLLVLRAPAQQD